MKPTANFWASLLLLGGVFTLQATELTLATFNVSMEASNYVQAEQPLSSAVLTTHLTSGNHPQIKNIAAIIQQVRPDILLLNEFDFIADPNQGIALFLSNYLAKSQAGGEPISYPYFYYQDVNTGHASGYDLNRDGNINQLPNDAWGFGHYPGQYGMVLLSRFPIAAEQARTFRHFKWQDMPQHKVTVQADGSPWYSQDAWAKMPLSSKSHWDVPVMIDGKPLHIFASHPTPPVFDGDENRNGHRNHDEVRFWVDYIAGANYMTDDQGQKGGFVKLAPFVVMGDLNASPDEGNAERTAIQALINHPKIEAKPVPQSIGAQQHSPDNPVSASHTAGWRMRADYVLPSKQGLQVLSSGVFWPAKGEPLSQVVQSRGASSDHRLVWVKVKVL